MAERAGYRITGETGSALVAEGGGKSFYIWAVELAGHDLIEVAEREQWRSHSLGAVEGVEVDGDKALWRWWAAAGYVIWFQAGPRGDSRIPTLDDMASLIRASQDVGPPGAQARGTSSA